MASETFQDEFSEVSSPRRLPMEIDEENSGPPAPVGSEFDDFLPPRPPYEPPEPPQLLFGSPRGERVPTEEFEERVIPFWEMPYGMYTRNRIRRRRCFSCLCGGILVTIICCLALGIKVFETKSEQNNNSVSLPTNQTIQDNESTLSPGDDNGSTLSPGDDNGSTLSPGDDNGSTLSPGDDNAATTSPTPFQVWQHHGSKIVGSNPGDLLGETIVLNYFGDVVAVGAPGANNSAGRVRVFAFQDLKWLPLGDPIDGAGQFGVSLDLNADGTILAVGGNLASVTDGGNKGHVRVFRYIHDAWKPLGDPLEGDQQRENMGWSVSLSSDGYKLAVGSPTYNDGAGRVQLFHYMQKAWTPMGHHVTTGQAGTGFAVSISSDATRIAVVSVGNDEYAHVSVWQRHNHTHYLILGGPITNFGDEFDHLGQRIQLSGDGGTIAIASRYKDNRIGHTQAYRYVTTETPPDWVPWGAANDANEDVDGDGIAEDHTAISINADGSHIAIASPHDDGNKGRVRVYQLIGPDRYSVSWLHIGEDIHGPEGFGSAVSLSGDADYLAVGAGHFSSYTGVAIMFKRHQQKHE